MALRLAQVEELEQRLLQLPALVDLLETQPARLTTDLVVWMKNAEQLLLSWRLSQASQIATTRARLLTALNSRAAPAGSPNPRAARAARRADALATAIEQANQTLTDLVAARRAIIEKGEQFALALATAARAKDIIPPRNPSEPPNAYADRLASLMQSDAQLVNPYLQLVTLVGRHDAGALLERAVHDETP